LRQQKLSALRKLSALFAVCCPSAVTVSKDVSDEAANAVIVEVTGDYGRFRSKGGNSVFLLALFQLES